MAGFVQTPLKITLRIPPGLPKILGRTLFLTLFTCFYMKRVASARSRILNISLAQMQRETEVLLNVTLVTKQKVGPCRRGTLESG